MDKPQLPENILNQLSEHSSCFILFYFNQDGTPCMIGNAPQTKDYMALKQLIVEHLNLEDGYNVLGGDDDDDEFGDEQDT